MQNGLGTNSSELSLATVNWGEKSITSTHSSLYKNWPHNVTHGESEEVEAGAVIPHVVMAP